MRDFIKPFIVVAITLICYACTDTLLGDQGSLDEDIYLNYQTKTHLKLPFKESWYMAAAGKTHEHGAHHFTTRGIGQRYAFDAFITKNKKSYSGTGTYNEDYYCFATNLYTPADGKIIAVENQEEDIRPGAPYTGDKPLGNHIIIDHFNGEFSFMAHFKKGSIVVKKGDFVTQGQLLGKTGNSGNSTQPHLHYHLQNTKNPARGLGLPAQFHDFYANAIYISRGEFTREDIVHP